MTRAPGSGAVQRLTAGRDAPTLPVPSTPPRRLGLEATSHMMQAVRAHAEGPVPRLVTQLLSEGVLDAELAALAWLLVEGHVPLVVAGRESLETRVGMLAALLDFLPEETRRLSVHGTGETFDWLPGAATLGWPARRDEATRADRPGAGDPEATYLVAAELGDSTPAGTWGTAARVLVRALQRGYGLGTTIHAGSLEEVLAALTVPPVSLAMDELRRLGTIMVVRERRVVAAHYLRPLERDGAGHLQRRPPAVLATWNAGAGSFDHYAWGVTPELALRVGRSPADFEREHEARVRYLAGLATRDIEDHDAMRATIAAYGARRPVRQGAGGG